MAVARRSMDADLRRGSVEGKVRLPNPDRGGVVESTSSIARSGLNYENYGGSREDEIDPLSDPSGHGVVPHAVRYHERTGRRG